MPALPDFSAVFRFTLKFTYGGDVDVVNRFFQKYGGTPGSLTTSQADTWSAHQGSAFSNKLFLNQVTLEDLTSNVGAVGIDTTGAQGGDTGVETPAGVAVIVSESIYRRYRGGHPRQYLAGLPASNLQTPQTIQPGFV